LRQLLEGLKGGNVMVRQGYGGDAVTLEVVQRILEVMR